MKSAKQLDYTLHHLCIYDDKPRDSIWPYLRWHHGITNYFSGAVFQCRDSGIAAAPRGGTVSCQWQSGCCDPGAEVEGWNRSGVMYSRISTARFAEVPVPTASTQR